MNKKVAVYIRVSTTEQKTEVQRTELLSYLKTRGWSNFEFYEDKATGTNVDRKAFKRLMSDAQINCIDAVVCLKLDRFARSLKDLVNNLQILTEHGIQFISVQDHIDLSTSSGRLMVHLLASFAEFEASLIRSRCKAGIDNAKRNGVRFGRKPFINHAKVFELRNQGLSMGAIARHLLISKSAVHKVLSQNSFTRSVINIETLETQESFTNLKVSVPQPVTIPGQIQILE